MKITNIKLNHYKRFLANQIKEFDASFTKPIVIILGTNGSGKTSLISELIPTADKSNIFFDRNGYKELSIYHEGHEYTLSTKSQGLKNVEHEFQIDGESKNPNKLFGSQQELISTYFNLDTKVADLLSNKSKMTLMKEAQRKAFFSKINPNDLSYLMVKYKDISAMRKSMESNIRFLNERKAALETELLSNDVIKANMELIESLKDERSNYTRMYDLATYEINKLSVNELPSVEDFPNIHQILFTIYELIDQTKVKPSSAYKHKIDLESKIPYLNSHATDLLNTLRALELELESLNKHFNEDETIKQSIDFEIQRLQQYVAENSVKFNDFKPFDSSVMNNFDNILTRFQLLVEQIEHVNASDFKNFRYITDEEIVAYVENASSTQLRLKEIQFQIERSQQQLNELHVVLQKHDSINVPSSCSADMKSECTLFKTFDEQYQRDQFTSKNLIELIDKLIVEQKELEQEQLRINEVLRFKEVFNTNINKIQSMFDEYHTLRFTPEIMSKTLIQILRNDPYDLVTFISNHHKLSKEYNNYLDAINQLNDYTMKRNSMDNNPMNRDALISLISSKQLRCMSIRNDIDKTENEHRDCLNKLSLVNNLIQWIDTYEKTIEDMIVKEQMTYSYFNRMFFKQVIDESNEKINELNKQISDVDRLIREQESVKSRLDKEVNVSLEKLTSEVAKIKVVEKELATLNYLYNLRFIKNVLVNVNIILNKIFVYDIQVYNTFLSKIKDEDISTIDELHDLDSLFTFSAKIDNHVDAEDISTCSRAQMNMIDLAFNIALLIELGITQYPIFLDEIDAGLDPGHGKRLFMFLQDLIDENVVEQIFLVSNTYFHDAFVGQTIILNDVNVVVPEDYNEDVMIKKY